MLSEELFSAVCGPPLAANTAVSKDVGVYAHAVTPSWAPRAAFKKSSARPRCLAVSDTHVYVAQDQKAHVHVYSRARGTHEALVPFESRIRSLALAGHVVVLGTEDGRLILWETCTGRQVATPPCHVQAVCCLAVTPSRVLSASDDSNINVWSLARLVELRVGSGHEPDLTLSNHRAAVTDLAVGPGDNAETSLCVSASRDKTCILWNYQTGHVLRTLLFPAAPLCLALDPCARALLVSAQDGGLYLVELFGDKPLLGSRAAELASIVVQVGSPLGVADDDAGVASCMAVDYNGTAVFTGHTRGKLLRWSLVDKSHPTEVANLNASVTNLAFAPLMAASTRVRAVNVVKPSHATTQRHYTLTAQLEGDLGESTFTDRLACAGVDEGLLDRAIVSFDTDAVPSTRDDAALQRENEELRAIVEEQRALQAATASLGESNKA